MKNECRFQFDVGLDVVFQVDGGTFVDEGAGEQEPVVWVVEPEGVLHYFGDVAELVAH